MLQSKYPLILAAALLLFFGSQAHAIILYSGDNTTNLTPPDTARENIFESVGRISGAERGSVVHIRGKYLLTAQHVSTDTNQVSFDGITNWEIDTLFPPVQIDSADLKLVKLVRDPGLPETPLFTQATGDIGITGTMIGWGVGRDPDLQDAGAGALNIWSWGSSETMQKRWGTNQIESSATGTVANFTYTFLRTSLDPFAGNNEAAITVYDSGSGLFIDDGGIWKLAGIATAVSTSDSSTFSFLGDTNFFARIATYAAMIESAIPELTTFEGWLIDNRLYDGDALNSSDTDQDGIPQFLEFAFGGDPHVYDRSILPVSSLVEEASTAYLQIKVTRPIGLQGLEYAAQTTSDLTNWPQDKSDILDPNPTPVNNGDGTETLTFRRVQAVHDEDTAFIRIVVTESI